MSADWVFYAMVAAGLLHVAEEYFGGFLEQMSKVIPGVKTGQFIFINTLFILLTIAGALVYRTYLVFSMSMAALLAINVLIHVVASIRLKGYSAGLVTALLLYLPIVTYAYYVALTGGELTPADVVLSFIMGVLWMLFVPIYLGVWLARQGRLSRKNIKF